MHSNKFMLVVLLCISSARATSENSDAANNSGSTVWDIEKSLRQNITELDATGLKITHLSKQDMQDFPNLEKVNMSDSGVMKIDPDSFELNPKLVFLDLSTNNLEFPANGSIILSKSLETLILSKTGLNDLRDDLLNGIPNLKMLDVSSNIILKFSEDFFQRLPNLTELIMSKDERFNEKTICQETSIKTITFKINDEVDEKYETIKCSDFNKQIDTVIISQNQTSEITNSTPAINIVKHEESLPENSTGVKTEISVKYDVSEVPEENVTNQPKSIEMPAEISKELNDTIPEETIVNTEEKKVSDNNVELPEDIKKDLGAQTPEKPAEESNVNRANIQMHANGPKENDLSSAESTENTKTSGFSGTNIVLGIIVCVAVIGVVTFGYQYWKKHRGYSHTNTEDNQEEGKELQTITTVNHHTDDEENKLN